MKKSTAISNLWQNTLAQMSDSLFAAEDTENPVSVSMSDVSSLYELCFLGTKKIYTQRAEQLTSYLRHTIELMEREIETDKYRLEIIIDERKKSIIKENLKKVETTRNQCVKICLNLEEKIYNSKQGK